MNQIQYLQEYPFLKALDRPLDSRQLRVCCTDGDDYQKDSVVVAAGAGSGKTQVLAARFAWLVITGKAEVDQILTLTFTKKAAAEMYQRIYAVLQRMSKDTDAQLTPEQQQRVENALAHFSNAHIQTLDSYCTYIVRQGCNRYGIRPDFVSGSEEVKQLIERSALSFVLAHQKQKGIVAIADAGSIQAIAEKVFAPIVTEYTSIISPADFFSSKIMAQCTIVAEKWNEVCTDFQQFLDGADTVITTLEKVCGSKKAAAEQKLQRWAQLLSACRLNPVTLTGEAICNHVQDDAVREYYTAVKNVLADCAKEVKSFRHTKNIDSAEVLYTFADKLTKFWIKQNPLDMIFAYIIHVDDAKDIMQLLDTFMMSINGIKRRTGHLTFADVSELALDILRTCDDIRQQEHDMYRRIMIDEFQDNNSKNGELLDLLQRPIFFVGDDKQSIYKFRGAEVAVFNDKQNAMLQGQGSVLHMDFNYRSNIELLHAFNQIFGGYVVKDPEALKKTDSTKAEKFKKIITVASDANDTDYPWVFPENFATDSNGNPVDLYKARFTIESTAEKNPEVTAKPEDLFINNNPLHCAVPVHAVMYNIHSIEDSPQKKDYLDAHKRLGKYVADTILRIQAECKKNNQSFSFSDFAILEKSRTNRSAYTDFLSRAGIPYVVDQQSNLFAEALVTDFYNFIRLCVYPFDVQAFASFLRSPFCGLSQHGVETVLCTAIKDPESPDAQPVVLQSFDDRDTDAIVAQLKGSDKDKYIKASTLFHTYQARIRSQKLTDTIRQLWVDLGYCYNIWWHKDLSVFAEQYDLLFALACRCDENNCTVPWFVDQLSKLQKMDNRKADSELNVKEISYPVESADAVSIMSIHKSKGLQFKYVFIVGCTGALSAESNSDMYFYTEQYGISVKYTDNKQNFFFKMQQDEATAKNDAEFRRQFYVALTRAEQQAWILGTWSQPLKDTSTSKPSLLERIFQHYYPILPQVQQDELDATGTEQTTLSLNESAPFDFTELYPVLQRNAYINAQKDSVDKQAMLKKIDELTPFFDTYADSALVTIPNLVIRRTSPSRFESDDTTEKSITSVDAYTDVNAIIESTWDDNTQKYGFGYNNFGTLVHLFLEMNAKGVDVSTFIPPANFVAHLYDSNRQCIFDTCRTMVAGFNESAVGKEFLQCRDTFYRTEYAFRMKLADYFVTGSIDLVYKAGDIFHIVDYKTDKAIHPEKYYEQLYCYRRALEGLLHIDPEHITCTLYYVRHACTIDVTQDVAKITEEHLQEKLVLFDKVVF